MLENFYSFLLERKVGELGRALNGSSRFHKSFGLFTIQPKPPKWEMVELFSKMAFAIILNFFSCFTIVHLNEYLWFQSRTVRFCFFMAVACASFDYPSIEWLLMYAKIRHDIESLILGKQSILGMWIVGARDWFFHSVGYTVTHSKC